MRLFAPIASEVALVFLAASVTQAADGYRVVHAYPHDQHAFTQGLIYRDGFLFESTGLNGKSTPSSPAGRPSLTIGTAM